MSSAETAQVAADLTASILGEAARNLAGEAGGDNAVRMLTEMGHQVVEAPQAPPVVSNVTPAANAAPDNEPAIEEPEAAEEPVAIDFAPQLSDELQALLDTPDFDEEALREVQTERDPDEYDSSFDPAEAAKDRAKDKRIEFLEGRLVAANRGKWLAENKKAYPLLATYAADDLAKIEADSRRAFARKAAELNERYSKVLAPAIADLNAAKAAAKTEAEAAARTKAADQWGLPAVEPAGSAGVSEQERALLEARERRAPLVERIKILSGLRPPM